MRIYFLLILLSLLLSCSKKNPLPDQILDYSLTNRLNGAEAKKFVDRIHLNEVATNENSIGFYSNKNAQSVIYITNYETSEIANAEFQRMTNKISPENSVFISGTIIKMAQKTIYRCFGMGQTHFVLTHQSMLIWISTETIGAEDFISTYIEYLE
jgi:hypothetical protein